MSKSLLIECSRIDEPAADDPVERQTWAGLRLFVNGMCVTQFWDARTQAASETVYLPVFAIADWLVQNWWSILYEPCRTESPPSENRNWTSGERSWLSRHCLRSSESALFLPYLHIFSGGPAVSVVWHKDESSDFSGTSGRFISSGSEQLDRQDVETALREFVSKVLHWCEDIDDPRVMQLKSDWNALINLDSEERAFCIAAGHLGLDPFANSAWPDGVRNLLTGPWTFAWMRP